MELTFEPPDVFGLLLQYPDERGAAADLAPVIARAHEAASSWPWAPTCWRWRS
jgi:hypothetical protein